jgi:GDSL-like Lipase/Acylhydrolase
MLPLKENGVSKYLTTLTICAFLVPGLSSYSFADQIGSAIQSLVPQGLMPGQPPASQLTDPAHWMAIVGDSSVTGAASSFNVEPNALSLLSLGIRFILHAEMEPYPPPPLSDFPNSERFHMTSTEPETRVIYSHAESETARERKKLTQLNLEAKGSLAVDVPEHASGYMVGRGLGIRGEDIVLVGQDGKRVTTIPDQLARIYEMQTETLPPVVILEYTANDFCNIDSLTKPLSEVRDDFDKALTEAWQKSEPYLRAHPGGTRFIILPGLEVANILNNKSIAEQTVYFQGMGEIQCGRIRNDENMNGLLTQRMVQALGGMCDTLYKTKPSETAKVQRIADIQNSFNEVWKAHIEALNKKYASNGVVFIYVEGLRSLQFSKGDAANDCFHPSVRGHAKIADYILRTVFGQ